MNYNALQAVLRQRYSHGLEFTLNYTYSKALTNSLGNYGLNVNGFSGAFQNYYDSAADWGPAGYDVRHNFSGTGVYSLPVGQGKEFLSGVNHLVDEVIGGWRVAAAAVAYSGFAQTTTGGSEQQLQQLRKLSAQSVPQAQGREPHPGQLVRHRSLSNSLHHPGRRQRTCAFGVAAPNTFGTARNGNVRGPGYLNVDMSAFKDFHTFREQTLGFRFDAFNTFNIASYGNPDTGVSDSNFGNVSTQTVRSTERRLQFSANYRF